MKTLTINTYDPSGRFNMNTEEATNFFSELEYQAIKDGYDVEYDECNNVDEDSEHYTTKFFENY